MKTLNVMMNYKTKKRLTELRNTTTMQTKDRQIATQSQLKLVLDWANTCSHCLSLYELTKITNIMVDYVENGMTPETQKAIKAIDEYLKNR